ncbi:MAG: DUF4215 domain-containing protein [Sandaracinaceae bacterium]
MAISSQMKLQPACVLSALVSSALVLSACASTGDAGGDSDVGAASAEITENNVDTGFVAVHPVTGVEDEPFNLASAITIGPRLLLGGDEPNIVDTRTGFLAQGAAGPMNIDIAGIDASSLRITIVGTDASTSSATDDNFAILRIDADLVARTFTGSIQDLSGPTDRSQFAWANQSFGSAASAAPDVTGFVGNRRDVIVDATATTLSISFPQNAPALQYAAHVELLDVDSDSLNSLGSSTEVLSTTAGTTARFDFPTDADLVVLTGYGFRNGTVAQHERKMVSRVVIREESGAFVASGVICMLAGSGTAETVTFGFRDYVVGTDASAPFVSASADTGSDTAADAISRHDLRLYFDGTELVVEEPATVSSNWTNMYNAQFSERTGAGSPARVFPASFGVGDFNSVGGSDFTFAVPAGATAGVVRYSAVFSNDTNENSGLVEIFIDLINSTSSGLVFGNRVTVGDLTAWSDVSLDTPTQLVTNAGLATGVVSNHANLGEYTDPQFGGITVSRESTPTGEVIRVQTVGSTNAFNPYEFDGAGASWLGREGIRLVRAPDAGTFSGSGYAVEPDGTVVLSVGAIVAGNVRWTPPDNFNGSVELGVLLDGEPGLISTFDLIPEARDDENERLSDVSVGDTDPSGDTVAALLGTSTQSPAAVSNGIAITALTGVGTGTYEYSLDGGGTWLAVGAVSETSARLLGPTDRLRFLPDGSTEGTGRFSYDAWDRSALAAGDLADTTADPSAIAGAAETLFSVVPDEATVRVAAACGNGFREPNEGCDDGGTAPGDGCDAACRIENDEACGDAAPGLTGAASCASGLCDVTGGAPGTCEAPLTCGNGVLEAAEGCDDGNTANADGCSAACLVETDSACNADGSGLTGASSCESGICDATGGAPGTCEAALACGNGVLEAGEGCDDGANATGDGCDASCQIEDGDACNAMAPGALGAAGCQSGICDTTSGAPGVCEPALTCGNGALEAGEACDDGNTSGGDGCSSACRIETGEPCGGGGAASCASGVCDTTGGAPGVCEAAGACGNAVLDAGEGCDDGGTEAGDGCNAVCQVENGVACNDIAPGATGAASCASGLCDVSGGAPGVCEATLVCGNNSLEAGEGCDDGGVAPLDGCDANCQIESGNTCNADGSGATGTASCASGICDVTAGAPGQCEAAGTCGNAVLEAGEGCDDGANADGDGCSATCAIETGTPCNVDPAGAVGEGSCASGICDVTGGAPGVCEAALACGNGVLEAGEGCDDGGTAAGDGCDASCAIETGTACNAVVTGDTGDASCASGICDVTGGAPGTCEAALACGNAVLEAGEGCDDGGTADGDGCSATCAIEDGGVCNDDASGAEGTASCASGICDVTGGAPGTCEPAGSCGNAVLEAGEGCDDGANVDGDDCDAACRIEDGQSCNATAPGLTDAASCASGVCDATGGAAVCEPADTCGNGVLESGEGCDDGNTTDGDGCAAACRVEDGQSCNTTAPGLTDGASCASGVCDATVGQCEAADTCGNGRLELGEGCDDGNTADGDGCSAACRLDDGSACNTNEAGAVAGGGCTSGICDVSGNAVPGVCEPADTCGNGVLEAAEGCDDGNLFEGDGCSALCLVENGATCGDLNPGLLGDASCVSGICNATAGTPGLCAPADSCGNGVLETGEGCDDGNVFGGDGCGGDCTIENGNACNATAPGLMGSASCAGGLCSPDDLCVPALTCGNGVLEMGEGCDDGDLDAGDGCNSNCSIENGGTCNTRADARTGDAGCESGVCDETEGGAGICEPSAACGNSVLEAGEGCDDGNAVDGDGCTEACRVESGGACGTVDPGLTGSASCATGFCASDTSMCRNPPACGDGRLDPGEGCDDGGVAPGDGCNAFCLVEDGEGCNATYPGVRLEASCASGICDATGGEPGTCEPPNTCGNSVLEAGEGCDDGNADASDGCSASCAIEDGNACNTTSPGTVGPGSCSSGVCNQTAGVPGMCMAADICGNGVLEAGEGCDDGALDSGDGCDGACRIENGGACNARDVGEAGADSCQSGVCDATGGAPGICEASNTCGNGTLEAGEGCDDGGTDPADGCSATCTRELSEACNDAAPGTVGNSSCESGACDQTGGSLGVCVVAGVCGNGVLESGEGCDDGDLDTGDGCNAMCFVEIDAPCNTALPGQLGNLSCATGLCNTGGGSPGVCRVLPGCGNGVIDMGEGCDDGNNDPMDGCNQRCLVENGTACGTEADGEVGDASCASGVCDDSMGAPGVCQASCGNGVLEDGEGCDDANAFVDDGCDADCLVEDGAACNADSAGATGAMSCASGMCNTGGGEPGICFRPDACGDGRLNPMEGCDDGNTDDGDGCTSACLIEAGEVCGDDTAGLTGSASCASMRCDTSGGAPGVCDEARADGGLPDGGVGDGGVGDPDADVRRTGGVAGGAFCTVDPGSRPRAPWLVLSLVGLAWLGRRRRR